MAYSIAEFHVLEKINALCRALDIQGYRQLTTCLVPDEERRASLNEKLKTWHRPKGGVSAMQDLSFFETLRDAVVRKEGELPRVLFKEGVSATELLEASVDGMVERLAEPFHTAYRRSKPAPAGAERAPDPPYPSGAMVHQSWDGLGQLFDRQTQGSDSGLRELRMMMTQDIAGMLPANIRALARNGIRIRIILGPGLGRADGQVESQKERAILNEARRKLGVEPLQGAADGSPAIEILFSHRLQQPFLALGRDFAVLCPCHGDSFAGSSPLLVLESGGSDPLLHRLHAEWESLWRDAVDRRERLARKAAQAAQVSKRAAQLLELFADPGRDQGRILQKKSLRNWLEFFADPGRGQGHGDGVIVLPVRRVPGADHGQAGRGLRWMQTGDLEAATTLEKLFRAHGIASSALVHADVHDGGPAHVRGNFEIHVGSLPDQTTRNFAQLNPVPLRLSQHPDAGDVPSLPRDLLKQVLAVPEEERQVRLDPDGEKFCWLLPRDWDRTYLERLATRARDRFAPDVHDYAVILRRCTRGTGRTVMWWLAGFTEAGTAAAAHYLATRWERLRQENGTDDFLMVIAGPADAGHHLGHWHSVGIHAKGRELDTAAWQMW